MGSAAPLSLCYFTAAQPDKVAPLPPGQGVKLPVQAVGIAAC